MGKIALTPKEAVIRNQQQMGVSEGSVNLIEMMKEVLNVSTIEVIIREAIEGLIKVEIAEVERENLTEEEIENLIQTVAMNVSSTEEENVVEIESSMAVKGGLKGSSMEVIHAVGREVSIVSLTVVVIELIVNLTMRNDHLVSIRRQMITNDQKEGKDLNSPGRMIKDEVNQDHSRRNQPIISKTSNKHCRTIRKLQKTPNFKESL